MTAPDHAAEGEHDGGEAVEEPGGEPTTDDLDALAYKAIARNGSLVPRSLLDFLR